VKPHILVTGGAGFIGSHTCLALHQSGMQPVVFDNLSRGHGDFCKWGPLVKADILETERLIRTIKEYKIDSVIHFAAYAYVGESVINPAIYYENNVMGTLSLLKACEQTQIENLIFSSSCATYGSPPESPIVETCPQIPLNPYGQSKKICEQMILDFQKISKMRAVCLRYFNAAGCDPELRIGEMHNPETHLIPNVILTALGKKSEFEIFGEDYSTPDGTCIRDYLHVMDLADAHVASLKKLQQGCEIPFALNLGTGQGHSVKEVIRATEQITNSHIPVRVSPRRPGDPPKLIASAELARHHIGFAPKYNLNDSIGHAWRWLSNVILP
jgi:UDP-arabinose 4-epimerase